MENRIEVTISVGDRRVTLEGPEEFVRAEVERLAGLPVGLGETKTAVAALQGNASGDALSERDLVAQKQPDGHVETVTVFAYYLSQQGQADFFPDDIRKCYLRAGVRPPKVVAQALRDAKNLKDYLEPGEQKGSFRISPHGERTVVFDMPRNTQN